MRLIQTFLIALFLIACATLSYGQEYQLNGSLGVGTNPADDKKLDVDGDTKLRGNTDVDGELRLTSEPLRETLLDKLLYLDDNQRITQVPSGLEVAQAFYQLDCTPSGAGNIPLWNNGLNKMFIPCTGVSVGIGMSNPSHNLHVDGNMRLDYSAASGSDMFEITDGTSTVLNIKKTGYMESRLTGSVPDFWRGYIGSAEDPVYLMRANGSFKTILQTGAPSAFEAVNDGNLIFKVESDGDIISTGTHYSNITSGSNTAFHARIDGDDIYRVDVNGARRSELTSDALYALKIRDRVSNDEIFLLGKGGSYRSHLDSSAPYAISVIGAGTTDEIFRVADNGNLWATKVTVELTPFFPDYVFSEDYELMPLHELRQFITENSRLPNMPTAEDIAENGADLGELNRLLVEKVEELTLYVLGLQDQIDALKESPQNSSK